MFFNAMRRKGWAPREADMHAVVAVHNAVNERAWREVRAWEAAAAGGGPNGSNGSHAAAGEPRLVEFRGRPRDHSPKARLLNLLGYRLPFDRHDWVVERGGAGGGGDGAGCADGAGAPPATRTRYVIDFYDAAAPGAPAAVHLDVRPALDSPAAAWARLRMQWRWAASGRWRRE
jgi:cytochrome c heme-lyase